jgi:hypothetical protein
MQRVCDAGRYSSLLPNHRLLEFLQAYRKTGYDATDVSRSTRRAISAATTTRRRYNFRWG